MTSAKLAAAVLAVACMSAPGVAPAGEPGQAPATGSAPDRAEEAAAVAHHGQLRQAAYALAGEDGTARDFALAALLLAVAQETGADASGPPVHAADPDAGRWITRAAAEAKHDVLANLLLLGVTEGTDATATAIVRREAAARWRAAEPDNLAPLLFMELEPSALLAAAGGTTRFHLHYVEATGWAAQALVAQEAALEGASDGRGDGIVDGAAAGAEERATTLAAGVVAAFALPSLQPLSEACSVEAAAADVAREAACRHVATTMRSASDTRIGAMFGRAIARRLSTAEDAAFLDAEERDSDWRVRQFLVATTGGNAAGLHRYYTDATLATERSLEERVIRDAGLSLVPPEGWEPRQAF